VSHPTGKPAHRLHLVGLAELVLQLLSLGDIGRYSEDLGGFPVGRKQRHFHRLKPPGVAGPRVSGRLLRDERRLRGHHLAIIPQILLDFFALGIEIRISLAEKALDGGPIEFCGGRVG
jgi:hypothetical protein